MWKWPSVWFPTAAATPEESRDTKKDKEGDRASEEGKQKGKGSKPLMPTSTILRLLAELVRSYVGIATLIANYSYTVGQSELIKEVNFPTSTWDVILPSFGDLVCVREAYMHNPRMRGSEDSRELKSKVFLTWRANRLSTWGVVSLISSISLLVQCGGTVSWYKRQNKN